MAHMLVMKKENSPLRGMYWDEFSFHKASPLPATREEVIACVRKEYPGWELKSIAEAPEDLVEESLPRIVLK